MLTNRDEMSNLYRGPSIDASYQVSEKIFFKSADQKQELMWRPRLLIDQDKIYNPQRGPSIDGSYQVSVQLTDQN